MTLDVECMAEFLSKPFPERIALNKKMKTEPPGREDQYEQDCDKNQNTSAFHANEIKDCGIELVSVAGRPLSRLFGDLAPTASGVVGQGEGVWSCRSSRVQRVAESVPVNSG